MLADSYGRVATDLRVSLTDRCNLRCAYCMPAEGLAWLPKPDLLRDDEVVRLVADRGRPARHRRGPVHRRRAAAAPRAGRHRRERTAALRPRPEMSLTTNGIGLDRLAEPLRAAGLDRINVSLDTLAGRDLPRPRPARPARRRPGRPGGGRRGRTGPVKVNTVLMRGMNDDEAVPLARFCLEHGYQIRFIEQMPLDAQHG